MEILKEGERGVRSFINDEGGTVESALVLIPLLILILSILQISLGVLSRDVVGNKTQSAVVQSGLISFDGQSSPTEISSSGMTSVAGLTLSGGGTLYIGTEKNTLPSLTPILPNGDSFTSIGVSLGEGQ